MGAHLGVEGRHHLGGVGDDRHRHLPADERLGHLEPDVAGADDHDPPDARRGPAGRVIQVAQQVGGVVERLHPAHERQVDPRKRWPQRAGPGAEVEEVEPQLERASLLVVADLDLAAVEVDRHGLAPHPHIDAEAVPQLLGLADDEVLERLHLATDQVRDAARRVRGPPPPLECHHVEAGILPAGGGRGRHPARVAPDHHQPTAHGPNLCDGCSLSRRADDWAGALRGRDPRVAAGRATCGTARCGGGPGSRRRERRPAWPGRRGCRSRPPAGRPAEG